MVFVNEYSALSVNISHYCLYFSTIITIAHRLNTILDYDRVLVLAEGRVAEIDSPRTLMNTEGSIFRGMCQVNTQQPVWSIN